MFNSVAYKDLKRNLEFIPVKGDKIAEKTHDLVKALENVSSEERKVITDFLSELGFTFGDENAINFTTLSLFDVRTLSKKYLAAKTLNRILDTYGKEDLSEEEKDSLIDKAATLPSWKKATDGKLALYEIAYNLFEGDYVDSDPDPDSESTSYDEKSFKEDYNDEPFLIL